ncbi:MAG: DUF481 domain-containing protein [Bacteroidota bacterium]|nr:DUF481 domain-containing protein [Bacteroidota bacterium]
MSPAVAVKITFFLLTLSFSQSFSQILNVEKSRLEEDSSKYFMGKASLGMNLNNRGVINDEAITFLGINASTDLAYFSKRHTYMFINFFNYISNNGNAFVSAGYSHFRINYARKNRMSYETFAQYQYDRPRGMNYRRLTGTGLRYVLFKSQSLNLTTGHGFFIEQEGWQSPVHDVPVQNVTYLKANNYLSIRWKVNENMNFNSMAYYQVGHDQKVGLFRQRISGEANASVRVSKKVSMKTTFSSTFENHPIVPVRKFIYTLQNGIEVNF